MGTSANKSTRKYSKRHLKKELAQRKRTQIIAKQKTEQREKLKNAALRKTVLDKEVHDKKAIEDKLRIETERFVKAPLVDDDVTRSIADTVSEDDLTEMDSEGEENVDALTKDDIALLSGNGEADGSSSSEEVMVGNDDQVKAEIAQYKKQLADLKQQDPEFYRYLQQADQQLLQFSLSSDDDDAQHSTAADHRDAVHQLTQSQVEKWCQAVSTDKPDLESLKCLITAYVFATQYGESIEEDETNVHGLVRFSSSSVYSKIMIFVLKQGVSLFYKCFEIDGIKKMQRQDILEATKKHSTVVLQLRRFFYSTWRLLNQALDDNVLAFVLRRIRSCVLLMEGTPAKISKMFLKTALEIFSTANHAPRLQAVLFIREMVLKLGPNTVHLCLKGAYKSFAASCSLVNHDTMPQIYFMGTCIIELYSLTPDYAYQHAFSFIKDLAIDLREAIIAKDKDGWKKVHSWRFVNCLELWSRLVSALSDKGDMKQLIYPIAQLLTGTARAQDQMRYVPMRLRLISSAISLAESTGLFIPVSSLLLGILSWSYLQKKSVTTGIDRCPDMTLCLSVDEKTAKSSVFQSEVFEEVLELLTKHLAQLSHSISFPETSHWISVQLRRFAKSASLPSYKYGAMQLATAIKECSNRVSTRRMHVAFSPRDSEKVRQFEVDGKSKGPSQLEVLCQQLEDKRRQRASLQTTNVVTIIEPTSTAIQTKKKRQKESLSLSDAESLTSDEGGELKEDDIQGLPTIVDLPSREDVLQEYVLSEDDDVQNATNTMAAGRKRKQVNLGEALPKQKRRKEKRKANRKNFTKKAKTASH